MKKRLSMEFPCICAYKCNSELRLFACSRVSPHFTFTMQITANEHIICVKCQVSRWGKTIRYTNILLKYCYWRLSVALKKTKKYARTDVNIHGGKRENTAHSLTQTNNKNKKNSDMQKSHKPHVDTHTLKRADNNAKKQQRTIKTKSAATTRGYSFIHSFVDSLVRCL